MNASQPLRAPDGAVAWSPLHGWIYGPDEPPVALASDDLLLIVSDDGHVYGVKDTDRAPLAAVLRVDAELVLLRRWHAALAARVSDVGDKQVGQDTDLSVELVALKARVRRLESER